MTAPDSRIVLLGSPIGLADDLIVDHPRQPADYTHMDGTVWTWNRDGGSSAASRMTQGAHSLASIPTFVPTT